MLSTHLSSARQAVSPSFAAQSTRTSLVLLQGSLRHLSGGVSHQNFQSAAETHAVAGFGSGQLAIGGHAQTNLLCKSKRSASQTHLDLERRFSLSPTGFAAPSPAVPSEGHVGWADVLQQAHSASDRWQCTERTAAPDEASSAELERQWLLPPQHWAQHPQLLSGCDLSPDEMGFESSCLCQMDVSLVPLHVSYA